jgi:hypothetical protein
MREANATRLVNLTASSDRAVRADPRGGTRVNTLGTCFDETE